MSDPKEPHYLTHQFHRGPDYYAGCFADPGAPIRLDASTTYTALRPRRDIDTPDAPGILDPVPRRILEHAPEARLIYIMRDPVKRAASAYRHQVRHDPEPAGPLSLMACMEADPMLVLLGRYADQIERYFEVIPPDRFLFLDFRDLTRDPLQTVARCCRFLDIPTDGIAPDGGRAEKHAAWHSTRAARLLSRATRRVPHLRRLGRQVLPEPIQRLLIDRVMRQPSRIFFHDEAEVAGLFVEDRQRVYDLTGLRI